jgi:uncharacterized protein (UPF0303 family)
VVTDHPSPAELAAQEAELVLQRFTNQDAIALGLALLDVASAESLPVVVDVRHGDQVEDHGLVVRVLRQFVAGS